MPGWFFAADGDGPKPTLMVANGSDGALSYLWPGHGSEAAARGYNVVLFDGPGQQRMLFERGVPFRPDWEQAEAAAGHCQPLARALSAQRFFDFFDDHVGLTTLPAPDRACVRCSP